MQRIRDSRDVTWQLANLPASQINQLFKSQDGKLFMTPSEPLLKEYSLRLSDSKFYSEGLRTVSNQKIPCVNIWQEDRLSVLMLSFSNNARKWISDFQREVTKLESDPNTKWSTRVNIGGGTVGGSALGANERVPGSSSTVPSNSIGSIPTPPGTKKIPVHCLSMIVARSFWERKILGERLAAGIKKETNPPFYPNTVVALDPLEMFIADLRLKNVYTSYVFILDSNGWVRWCCSGKPTARDIRSFDHVLTRLSNEKK